MILVSGLEVGDPIPPGCWVVSSLDEAVESVSSVRGDSLLVCTRTEASRPSVMTREVIARDDLAMVVSQGPPTRQALVLRALSMLPPTSYGLAQHVADTLDAGRESLCHLSQNCRRHVQDSGSTSGVSFRGRLSTLTSTQAKSGRLHQSYGTPMERGRSVGRPAPIKQQ